MPSLLNQRKHAHGPAGIFKGSFSFIMFIYIYIYREREREREREYRFALISLDKLCYLAYL
jgi:hypothetical protein